MSRRKWTIKDKRYACPRCGHNVIVGKSRQTGEDCCEMWVECEKCGYDPTGGDSYERVETVWGWEDELAGYACEIWHDKLAAQPKPAETQEPPMQQISQQFVEPDEAGKEQSK